METFARILNFLTDTFAFYDFELNAKDSDKQRKLIDDAFAKIKDYSPKCEMQYWSDTLGNLLNEWDHINKVMKGYRKNSIPDKRAVKAKAAEKEK